MNLVQKYGAWACVAGAAEGLGRAFAERLAGIGFHLIMVDRKQELLSHTCSYIEQAFGIQTQAVHADLNEYGSVAIMVEKLREKHCRFLLYNAAYGPVKSFLSNEPDELDRYLNVNARTAIHLIHQMAGNLKGSEFGILLISSLAGFRGTQLVAPYAATKAFLWNLAESLHYEFKNQGLTISVCCPGTIDTPNYRATRPKKISLAPAPLQPEAVAAYALSQFGKRLLIFPGKMNKLTHFVLQRILPRAVANRIHNNSMKKMYS